MEPAVAIGDYVRDTVTKEEGYVRLIEPDGSIVLDCIGMTELCFEPYFYTVPRDNPIQIVEDTVRSQDDSNSPQYSVFANLRGHRPKQLALCFEA